VTAIHINPLLGGLPVTTIRVVANTTLPPDRVLYAARDFSERRADIFPAVSVPKLEVHSQGETSANVTEGTRAGFGDNWERCDYDWSQPDLVRATVTDSNVYAVPGSSWEIAATPSDGGSRVEMTWVREFRGNARGRIFGTAFRLFGNRIFNKYGRDIVENLEKVEAKPSPDV
jgi:polyketide cyclase/dehydrase/lipid transport protein